MKPDKPKDPAAVAMGKRRAASLTPEHQARASRARWGDTPRCPCGCGLSEARGKQRHPKRLQNSA